MNTTTFNSLIIFLRNANGAAEHRNELEILLHDRGIDIALRWKPLPYIHFLIKNYTIYRTDHSHDTAQDSSALLIRSNLFHFLLLSTHTESV